jgi:hypothetical protein
LGALLNIGLADVVSILVFATIVGFLLRVVTRSSR